MAVATVVLTVSIASDAEIRPTQLTPLTKTTSCGEYEIYGIAVNDSAWIVRAKLGEPFESSTGLDDVGRPVTIESFEVDGAEIRIRFDRSMTKKQLYLARVDSFEVEFVGDAASLSGRGGEVLDRFGRPDTSRKGDLRWSNDRCGIEAQARRLTGQWWDPTKASRLHVSVSRLIDDEKRIAELEE